MASLDDPLDYSQITGNAPEHVKEAALIWYKLLHGHNFAGFGHRVRKRLRILEVSVEASSGDPHAECTKMVCEVQVEADMCNAQGVLDHGCMLFLLDEGSAISLVLLKTYKEHPDAGMIGVSQTLNMLFHDAPPSIGATLRIVSRSAAVNDAIGIGSCSTEIWNKEKHSLVASGSQMLMQASEVIKSQA